MRVPSVKDIIKNAAYLPLAFVATCPTSNGKAAILSVNEEMVRLCGYDSAEELTAAADGNYWNLIAQADRENIQKHVAGDQSAIGDHIGRGHHFFDLIRKDGSRLRVEDRGCLVEDDALGKVFTLYITPLDYTDFSGTYARQTVQKNKTSVQTDDLSLQLRVTNDEYGRENVLSDDKRLKAQVFDVLSRMCNTIFLLNLDTWKPHIFVYPNALQYLAKLDDYRMIVKLFVQHSVLPDYQEAVRKYLDPAFLPKRLAENANITFVYQDRDLGWCRAVIMPAGRNEKGLVNQAVVSIRTVNAEQQYDAKVRYYTSHDPLTHLLNRMGMQSVIEQHFSGNEPLGLVVMDIDHFKFYNDTYGHAVGDKILIKVAGLLVKTFREEDYVIRTGGDEFLVLMPGYDAALGSIVVKEKVQHINQMLARQENRELICSISAGAAFSHDGYHESLFKEADASMYLEKKMKKGANEAELGQYREIWKKLAFSNVSDKLPVSILAYRADPSEEILFVSRSLCQLFECDSVEEFLTFTKHSFRYLVHPDDIDRVEAFIEQQIAESDENIDVVDYRIITKKGNIRYIHDFGRLIENDQFGPVFYVVLFEKEMLDRCAKYRK